MKIRFASRFSPRKVAEMAAKRFSLFLVLVYFFNKSIISRAPVLMESFCTCASFWLADAQICSAISLEFSSLEQKMILRRMICPPNLQSVAPRSRESSNSCSSSRLACTASASSSMNFQRVLSICLILFISELQYSCMASSSHFLSYAGISLNSDFLVPSVYFSENFKSPSQSIILIIEVSLRVKYLYYLMFLNILEVIF